MFTPAKLHATAGNVLPKREEDEGFSLSFISECAFFLAHLLAWPRACLKCVFFFHLHSRPRLHAARLCLKWWDSEAPDEALFYSFCFSFFSLRVVPSVFIFLTPPLHTSPPVVPPPLRLLSLPGASTSLQNLFCEFPRCFFFTCQTQSVCEPPVFAYLLSGGSVQK